MVIFVFLILFVLIGLLANPSGDRKELREQLGAEQQRSREVREIVERQQAALTQQNQAYADQLNTALAQRDGLRTLNQSLISENSRLKSRPLKVAVYQEHSGRPIPKSPLVIDQDNEGVLKTSCGNFVFKARLR